MTSYLSRLGIVVVPLHRAPKPSTCMPLSNLTSRRTPSPLPQGKASPYAQLQNSPKIVTEADRYAIALLPHPACCVL